MKSIIIPSAKLIPLELQIDFGAIPSAMIPLEGTPAICYILSPYVKRGFEPIISVFEHADSIENYLESEQAFNPAIVNVGETQSLGETIWKTLQSLQTLPDELVINFADTFVGDELPSGDFIAYAEAADAYRWTSFTIDQGKNIVSIEDKEQEKSDEHSIFVGVFGFSDAALFQTLLEQQLKQNRHPGLDPFYSALQEYFNIIPVAQRSYWHINDWRDFGHLDTYYATRKRFFINKRFFNSVEIDEAKGIVRKQSHNKDDFRNEIKWYLDLPKELQHIAPRVFGHDLSGETPHVLLEFYGYPPLNDVYLFGNCSVITWKQIFSSIFDVVNEMADAAPQNMTADAKRDTAHFMYYEKTMARLDSVLSHDDFSIFGQDTIQINSKPCIGLPQALIVLEEVLLGSGIYQDVPYSIIHGDLCLSNILYDQRNRLIRLIDPRGSFGTPGIYGDMRYDLAKLSHSVDGDYDFFVNGLFSYREKDGAIEFSPRLSSHHLKIKETYERLLVDTYGQWRQQIKLIEALLFLSMVPMHADRPKAQKAFVAQGLELFTDVSHHLEKPEAIQG